MDKLSLVDQKNKAHNDINRAERARQVMSDPMLQEALTAIKGDLFNKFCRSKFKETEEREEIHRSMKNIQKFEGYLESVMTDGKMGQETLNLLEKAKQLIGL
ncbi:MAG: hypothetical protein JKX91_06540 [Rhizobiaceae bacterium]|nr:hypothetical protein [Rhizobiaceae bacterium]